MQELGARQSMVAVIRKLRKSSSISCSLSTYWALGTERWSLGKKTLSLWN